MILIFWFCRSPFVGSQTSGKNSPTHSQSTGEFDWRSLLAISPARPSIEGSSPMTPQKKSSPECMITAVTSPLKSSKILLEGKKKILHHVKSQQSLILSEKEKRLKRLTKERYKRYKDGVRQKTGFSSHQEARLHYFRTLEASGKATEEQLAILHNHRAKRNLRRRRLLAKKRIEQTRKDKSH